MKEALLEELIQEFHQTELPVLFKRQASLPLLPGKIDTVVGMRRTGKSFFLFQIMEELLAKKVPKSALLYLNFEDERLLPLETEDLSKIVDGYYRLYPNHHDSQLYFMFDEIQNIPAWDKFVRRLLDTRHIHICLSGSSAKLLSSEIATALRGRSLSTEIFPYSFREVLLQKGMAVPERRASSRERSLLEHTFKQYLLEGGFPEVQDLEASFQIRILQEYVDVVVLRDVIERHQVREIIPLRYLVRHILHSPATLFSVNKFYNSLKGQGVACSKDTLHLFLEYLTEAYLIYPVPIASGSLRVRQVNPRKIYAIDTGLLAAFGGNHHNLAQLLENHVFMTLRRQGLDIGYYKTESGYEVDFKATFQDDSFKLIQVAVSLEDQETQEREIRALREAMQECKAKEAWIVTLNEQNEIKADEGTIHVVPAWLWSFQ